MGVGVRKRFLGWVREGGANMECHKCRHSAAVESGKYSGRFFRHSPCYRCELTHNSHYTMEFKPWMHERAAEVESEPEPDRGPLWRPCWKWPRSS